MGLHRLWQGLRSEATVPQAAEGVVDG
jgi:hypothetical protein